MEPYTELGLMFRISGTCFAVAKALAATKWSFMGRIYSSPMAS